MLRVDWLFCLCLDHDCGDSCGGSLGRIIAAIIAAIIIVPTSFSLMKSFHKAHELQCVSQIKEYNVSNYNKFRLIEIFFYVYSFLPRSAFATPPLSVVRITQEIAI